MSDIIWDAKNFKRTVVASRNLAPEEEEAAQGEETALEKAVEALTIHIKKK